MYVPAGALSEPTFSVVYAPPNIAVLVGAILPLGSYSYEFQAMPLFTDPYQPALMMFGAEDPFRNISLFPVPTPFDEVSEAQPPPNRLLFNRSYSIRLVVSKEARTSASPWVNITFRKGHCIHGLC